MDVDDFLTQFVEGYLLSDLSAMAAIAPPAGEAGACGYSMVLVTLAGCELLGAMTFLNPFDPNKGGEHFTHFWRNAMYPTDHMRSELAPTIYQLVRHGLAHAFVTKPQILITKNNGTKNHLCRDEFGVLTIDCLALADDFRGAFRQFVSPQLTTAPGRSALQRQLDLMRHRQTVESERHAIRIRPLPYVDATEGQAFVPSGQIRCNSPAMPLVPKSRP